MEKAKRNTVILLVLAVLLFGVVTAFLLNFAQNDEKTSAEVPAAQPTANERQFYKDNYYNEHNGLEEFHKVFGAGACFDDNFDAIYNKVYESYDYNNNTDFYFFPLLDELPVLKSNIEKVNELKNKTTLLYYFENDNIVFEAFNFYLKANIALDNESIFLPIIMSYSVDSTAQDIITVTPADIKYDNNTFQPTISTNLYSYSINRLEPEHAIDNFKITIPTFYTYFSFKFDEKALDTAHYNYTLFMVDPMPKTKIIFDFCGYKNTPVKESYYFNNIGTTLSDGTPNNQEKDRICASIRHDLLIDIRYRFLGWYENKQYTGERVDGGAFEICPKIMPGETTPKTFYAKIEQFKFFIIYESEDSRFKIPEDISNVRSMYESGKEFALPASDTIVVQQKYGRYQYRIVKWYLKGDESKTPITSIPSTATGNQTVVGIAEQRTFEVRLYDLGNVYDVIGGAGDYGYYNSQKLPTVSEIKVFESSKKYRFLGWYFDMYFVGEPITEIPANYMPTSDPNKDGDREINIYPKFEQYIFKITYAYENWKGLPNYNMIDGLCEYENGVGLTLWGCIAQVSFVDFDGWYLKEDVTIDENGKEVIHLITKIEPTAMGNKTLYARCHINVDIYNTERAGSKDPFEPDFNIETDGAISEKKIDTMHFQPNGVLSKTDLEKYDKSKLPYYVFDKYIVRYQRADGTATVITQSEFPSADMVVVYDENIKKMDIVLSYKQAPGTLSIQPIICGFVDKNNTIKDYVLTPFAAIPGWNVMLSPEIYAFNQKVGAKAGALYKFVCWSIVPTTATDWNAKKQVKPFNADSLLTLTSDVKIYANFEKIANTYCDTQNILTSQADEAAFLQLYENTETVPEEKPSDKPTTPDEVINDITVKFDKMLSKVKVVFELQKSVTYKWNNIGAKDFWSVYNFKVYAVALGGLLALIAIIMIIKLLVVFFRTLTRPINKAYKKSQRKRR